MMNTYRLHKWSVVNSGDAYRAPEQETTHLSGFRDDEDRAVVTSRVVKTEGRTITTRNNIYILEDICPEYLQFLKDNNIAYDENDPIKIVSQRTPIVVERKLTFNDPSLN